MMISNFKPIKDKEGFATVDVSFFGLFKRERVIYKDNSFWKWLDNGLFTTNLVVERLESKYKAEKRFNE